MESEIHDKVMSTAAIVAEFFGHFRETLLTGGCLSVHKVITSFDLVEGEILLSSDSGQSESEVVYGWLSEDGERAVVTEQEALLTVREALRRLAAAGFFEQHPFAMDVTIVYQSGGAKDKTLYSHSDSTWDGIRHDKLLKGASEELDLFLTELLQKEA